MKKPLAVSILATMVAGLLGFLTTEVYSHNQEIGKLQTQDTMTYQLLKEVRDDVKYILKQGR